MFPAHRIGLLANSRRTFHVSRIPWHGGFHILLSNYSLSTIIAPLRFHGQFQWFKLRFKVPAAAVVVWNVASLEDPDPFLLLAPSYIHGGSMDTLSKLR